MAGPWERYQTRSDGPWKRYQTPPDPSALDYASGTVGGVNVGLAGMVGAPVDLVNAGLGLVNLDSETPFMGSEWIKNRYRDVEDVTGSTPGVMTDKGPDTATGRVLHRVGEEVGASLVPGGLIVGQGAKVAARAHQAAKPVTSVVKGAVKDTLARVGISPGKAAAGEAAAVVSAGLGAGVAKEAAPDSPGAEIAGQIVGGFAPTALANTPANLVRRGVNAVRGKVSTQAQREAAQEVAGDFIDKEMTTDARDRLAKSLEVSKEVPGFEPTTAQRTGAPGLVAAQSEFERSASPEMIARRLADEEAIARYGELNAPQSVDGIDYVIDTATKRVQSVKSKLADQSDDIDQMRRGLADDVPTTDRASAGLTIREGIAQERRATQDRMSALADELGINDADVTVDFERARQQILEEFGPRSVFDDASNAPDVLRVLRELPEGQTITFRDLKGLRERITDDLIDAMGSANPSRKKVRALTALRARTDGIIDDLTRSADPELADRYRQFRTAYFEEYVNRFERGNVFKVGSKDGRAFYRTPDERVAEAFFKAGNVAGAREFNALFPNAPAPRAALADVVLDSLRSAAVRDGTLNQGAYQNWLKRHESVLQEFPDIGRFVDDIGEANAALLERQTELTARTHRVENAMLARHLDSYTKGTKTPEAIIKGALRDPRLMNQLVSSTRRSPDAINALRRVVWEQAAALGPGDMTSFINDNRRSLTMIMTPRHMQSLRTIDAARSILARTPTPRGGVDFPTNREAFAKTFGVAPEMIANRLHTLNTGRSEKTWVVTNLMTNILARKQQGYVDDALKVVLYDPEMANDMARAIRIGRMEPTAAKRLGARFFALGVAPFDERTERDPVAATR